MKKAPTTLPEFHRMFPDEQACRAYLLELRWPEGFVCPKCGATKGWWLATSNPMIECAEGHKTSITSGTAMHRTKQPLLTWFFAAYLVSTLTPGISAVQFQRQLGLSRYETAFQMLHKLRSALVAPDRERLHGEVEVDEAYVGGEEHGTGKRGRGTSKALVVVGVEVVRYDAPDPTDPDNPDAGIQKVRAGRVRMTVIPDATADVLVPWVKANVLEGALVLTDGLKSYNGLAEVGFAHRRVLQKHEGKSTGQYLPMVHLIISNLKRWLLGTHKGAVDAKHLQAYLNEFVFRFNRRFWRGPAFERALGLAVGAEKWPEYETLYDGDWIHPNPEANL